jgi:methylase of polypeptide subunit release factors
MSVQAELEALKVAKDGALEKQRSDMERLQTEKEQAAALVAEKEKRLEAMEKERLDKEEAQRALASQVQLLSDEVAIKDEAMVCVCVSVCLAVWVSRCLRVCVSVSASLSLCVCVSVCVCLYLSGCQCFCTCVYVRV